MGVGSNLQEKKTSMKKENAPPLNILTEAVIMCVLSTTSMRLIGLNLKKILHIEMAFMLSVALSNLESVQSVQICFLSSFRLIWLSAMILKNTLWSIAAQITSAEPLLWKTFGF